MNGNRVVIQNNIRQYDNSIYSNYNIYERKLTREYESASN